MFTGIIEKTSQVISLEHSSNPASTQSASLVVENNFKTSPLTLGESIAVNGVCLTVSEYTDHNIHFFVSPETLSKTNLSKLRSGSNVNLERALLVSHRLSGHLVQGHVDGVAKLVKIEAFGSGSTELQIEIPHDWTKYCVLKGSLCLNGVSLTINQVTNQTLSFMIVPHTWEHTQFRHLNVGDELNFEVDVIAKYVEKLCLPFRQTQQP
jgi:riboflavin synthase